ncbi:MAG TPA: DUF3426 domain-containing protein [Ramlibacter sp.]|nr:DUF3426 domain-containing protein [Ramlibacter sp.]
MSLITRCPACGTMFKVVPDQLKISEGWVRCGQCSEVFDASAHLQATAPAGAQSAIEHAKAGVVEATPGPVPPAAAGPESEAFGASASSEIGESLLSEEEPDSAQIDAEALALQEHPLDQPFELRRQDAAEEDDSSSSQDDSGLEPESQLHGDLTFVRQARRQAFWRRPAVRVLMAVAAVALAALLVLQVAVQERDRLAASEPALRPWLAMLCGAVNCTIGPQRRIDAIAIDSSSFNQLRGDAYRLQVTLKNQGATEVAMPALELTLTDSQERAVVRRVLMPGELGASSGVIAPASEWSSSLALAVTDTALGGKIAGYRLLAFYP